VRDPVRARVFAVTVGYTLSWERSTPDRGNYMFCATAGEWTLLRLLALAWYW